MRADLRTHYHAVSRACTCQSLYPFTGPQGASGLVNNHNIPIASDSRLQLATCAGGRGGRAEETQKGDHRSLRLAHRPHATAGNLHVYTLCNAPSVYHLSFQVSPTYLASTLSPLRSPRRGFRLGKTNVGGQCHLWTIHHTSRTKSPLPSDLIQPPPPRRG